MCLKRVLYFQYDASELTFPLSFVGKQIVKVTAFIKAGIWSGVAKWLEHWLLGKPYCGQVVFSDHLVNVIIVRDENPNRSLDVSMHELRLTGLIFDIALKPNLPFLCRMKPSFDYLTLLRGNVKFFLLYLFFIKFGTLKCLVFVCEIWNIVFEHYVFIAYNQQMLHSGLFFSSTRSRFTAMPWIAYFVNKP